ncbi:hypothetical protein ACQF1E_003965, partial [Shigella flexneri]
SPGNPGRFKLLQMTGEWLNTTGAAQQSPEHRS